MSFTKNTDMEINKEFLADFKVHTAQLEQGLKEQPIVEPAPPYAATGGAVTQLSDWQVQEIVRSSKMDLAVDTERPPYCLFIDDAPVLGLGDISTIIGKAKSRKTFASGLILAAMAGNTSVNERIRGELPFDKQDVLLVDTEQSEFYAKTSARRVFGILNKDYMSDDLPNFHAHTLRPYSPPERLQVIENLIYSMPNLGFVVIDGIRDLITSINDEEQATMITSKLLKWSTERMIHICCVLHMNKADNNARGHVGTELMNKSLAVLGVNKIDNNEEYSEIIPIATRDKEPASIVFGVEDGLPYILSEEDADALRKTPDKKKVVRPTDWTDEEHTGILGRMFEKEPQMKYGDFVFAVQNAYGNIGQGKAKQFISHFKNKELIKWEEKGRQTIYTII